VVTLASLARYAATGSLWVVTLALAVLGDRAPRRVYPGMLTVASAAAAAVTAGILADELARRAGDHVTESCLAAIEIDRAAQKPPRGGRVSRLRTAGDNGDLASRASRRFPAAPRAKAVSQI
jgi:hypothetical protein